MPNTRMHTAHSHDIGLDSVLLWAEGRDHLFNRLFGSPKLTPPLSNLVSNFEKG